MRTQMRQRIEELSREIRNYPTPIARCDEQLSGLLEERAMLLRRLNESRESPGGCSALGIWSNDGGARP